MKKALVLITIIFMLVFAASCKSDTPIALSGLTYDEVCAWTKTEWNVATDDEKTEALYLLIDKDDDKIDSGKSAKASLKGFKEAFKNASDTVTLKELFDGAAKDEIIYNEK